MPEANIKPKVLIVEDDESSVFILSFLLEKQGFQVIWAADGSEGLEVARQAMPDLILLDLWLPRMDGYAVAQALRDMPLFAHVPILAVTSLPIMDDLGRALASGCNDYIEKPIDEHSLITKIKQHWPPHSTER